MSPPLRPCAVDLGSGTCGLVAATLLGGSLSVIFAEPLPVDKADTTATVEAILSLITAHGCDCLILEVGHLFDAGKATVAIGEALAVCREIVGGLRFAARTAARPFAVHQISRRSWSSRLVPGRKGGVTNADAADAAVAGLPDDEAILFRGDRRQHLRDALGALRGWLLKESQAAEDAARAEVRAALPKREPGAPTAPRAYVAVDGDRKRRKNRADRERQRVRAYGWIVGEDGATVKPDGWVRKAKACGKCNGPQKGHVRGLPCPAPAPTPAPT